MAPVDFKDVENPRSFKRIYQRRLRGLFIGLICCLPLLLMDAVVPRRGGFVLLRPPAALVSSTDSFHGGSVLSGTTQALDIVRGIKLCFVATLSLSPPALSASRFMLGESNSPGDDRPMGTAQSNPQRLDPCHLSPLVRELEDFLCFFTDYLEWQHWHLRVEAREPFSCNHLPAREAEASTSKNALIAFQRGDDAGAEHFLLNVACYF